MKRLCRLTPWFGAWVLPVFALLAVEPTTFSVGAFTFNRPSGWGWIVPTSPMRKAELHPPAVNGEKGPVVTFFYFGKGQGGSLEQNVARWVGQFEGADTLNPERRSKTFGSTQVTYVRVRGTFLSGMPGGPTTPEAGSMLYGAILESAEGDVYVKMTGPERSVEAAIAEFEGMIQAACLR